MGMADEAKPFAMTEERRLHRRTPFWASTCLIAIIRRADVSAPMRMTLPVYSPVRCMRAGKGRSPKSIVERRMTRPQSSTIRRRRRPLWKKVRR